MFVFCRLPKDRIPIEAPDVHIILLDSVSMSQFFRSMPITTHYLRTENDAIIFPYLNKVGLNSRPNAYGFLMGRFYFRVFKVFLSILGERAENLPPNPWGKEMPRGRGNELCQAELQQENFIIFDYQRRGYRTYLHEDWAIGVSAVKLDLCLLKKCRFKHVF